MSRFDPERAAELVREARLDIGMTQAELAAKCGLHQPTIAQIEAGRRKVTGEMLERILEAADYRPSIPVERHSREIQAIGAKYGFHNIRVFGSVARGSDGFSSDIDLLVTGTPGQSLFEQARFMNEVESLTGFPVQVLFDRSVPEKLQYVLDEAVPV